MPLSQVRQIPVGSFLNTKKGKLRVQSATNRQGTRQNGDFAGGLFQILQSRKTSAKGLTELNGSRDRASPAAESPAAASAPRRRPHAGSAG